VTGSLTSLEAVDGRLTRPRLEDDAEGLGERFALSPLGEPHSSTLELLV
jgi:hypothetical protein